MTLEVADFVRGVGAAHCGTRSRLPLDRCHRGRSLIEPQCDAGDLDGGEIARARLVICRLEGPLGLFVDLDKVLGVRPRWEHFRESDDVTDRLLVEATSVPSLQLSPHCGDNLAPVFGAP